jgi:hypothetical protein
MIRWRLYFIIHSTSKCCTRPDQIFNCAQNRNQSLNLIKKMWSGHVLVLLIFYKGCSILAYDRVFAVNFGERVDRVDSNGILFNQSSTGQCKYPDALVSRTYSNVPDIVDQAIYQYFCLVKSPEYSMSFGIPLWGDGKYLLIVKFVSHEIFHGNAQLMLNKNHRIFKNLNVYQAVGNRNDLAYDEYILFTVCGSRLKYKNEESSIVDSSINFELTSPDHWIGVVAMALFKGDVENYKVQPKIAINFNSSDFDHQADFKCRGNNFLKIVSTTTTTTSTIKTTTTTTVKPCIVINNNNSFVFNFFMSKIQSPSKSEILSVDEI